MHLFVVVLGFLLLSCSPADTLRGQITPEEPSVTHEQFLTDLSSWKDTVTEFNEQLVAARKAVRSGGDAAEELARMQALYNRLQTESISVPSHYSDARSALDTTATILSSVLEQMEESTTEESLSTLIAESSASLTTHTNTINQVAHQLKYGQ